MARALLLSLVSCLAAVSQASLIRRCDLAKVLHEEDLDGFEGYSLSDWLCLAFVQSNFNISKVNENTDGSFDYGIFQINSHYWCNDHKSHSENLCDVDCQGLAWAPGWERVAEPQSALDHQLCKKDRVQCRGDEELGRMEVALFGPAALLLDDRVPPGVRPCAGLLWSQPRTPLFAWEFFISSSSCLPVIFFPSRLQIKLTRAPGINGFLGLSPYFHPGPGPWFLTFANQEDHHDKVSVFLELLKHSLYKE
uniref:Lysozyme like 6 n=1 Tax=Equus asinus TaxID=9793 RepID=A0A8C4LZ76_EQUAS